MDIDLLSKMVKELILDNDRVVLPGLGYFAAEIVPSTFSDRGYTINPPYRKLYFRQDMGRDGLLARLYAESNGTGTDVAEHILEDFVRDMREVLDREKVIIFPGLGRLRATKENNYFFVPDEDLDIYPEGAGLEPVSLKTHNAQIVPPDAIPGLDHEPDAEPEILEPEAEDGPAVMHVENVPVEDVEVLPEAVAEANAAEDNAAGDGDKAEEGISGNEGAAEKEDGEKEDGKEEDVNATEEAAGVPGEDTSEGNAETANGEEEAKGGEENGEDGGRNAENGPEVKVEGKTEEKPKEKVLEKSEEKPAEKVGEKPEYAVENVGAGEEKPGTGENGEEKVAEEKEDKTGEDRDEAETWKDREDERMGGDEGGKIKKGMPKWLRIMLIVSGAAVALAVIALAVFVLLANVSPDFVDSILYSPDELEILKY